jgi:hypothetical protein
MELIKTKQITVSAESKLSRNVCLERIDSLFQLIMILQEALTFIILTIRNIVITCNRPPYFMQLTGTSVVLFGQRI